MSLIFLIAKRLWKQHIITSLLALSISLVCVIAYRNHIVAEQEKLQERQLIFSLKEEFLFAIKAKKEDENQELYQELANLVDAIIQTEYDTGRTQKVNELYLQFYQLLAENEEKHLTSKFSPHALKENVTLYTIIVQKGFIYQSVSAPLDVPLFLHQLLPPLSLLFPIIIAAILAWCQIEDRNYHRGLLFTTKLSLFQYQLSCFLVFWGLLTILYSTFFLTIAGLAYHLSLPSQWDYPIYLAGSTEPIPVKAVIMKTIGSTLALSTLASLCLFVLPSVFFPKKKEALKSS